MKNEECRTTCKRILAEYKEEEEEEGNAKLHDKANNWEEKRWTGSSLDLAPQSASSFPKL